MERFVIDREYDFENKFETLEVYCICDTKYETFYIIVDSLLNVKLFIARLNYMDKENKLLKKEEDIMLERFELAEQLENLSQLLCLYDNVREEYLTLEDMVELINELNDKAEVE